MPGVLNVEINGDSVEMKRDDGLAEAQRFKAEMQRQMLETSSAVLYGIIQPTNQPILPRGVLSGTVGNTLVWAGRNATPQENAELLKQGIAALIATHYDRIMQLESLSQELPTEICDATYDLLSGLLNR